jgi:predicted nucleotidyltransferase component of viral defense system
LDGGRLSLLTRKQIEKIALKNRVSLFTQERDYVQAVYLSLLYSKTIGLIFKGGTCLRIAYSSPRYSEYLDFNSNLDEDEAYKTLETAVKELEYFGKFFVAVVKLVDIKFLHNDLLLYYVAGYI